MTNSQALVIAIFSFLLGACGITENRPLAPDPEDVVDSLIQANKDSAATAFPEAFVDTLHLHYQRHFFDTSKFFPAGAAYEKVIAISYINWTDTSDGFRFGKTIRISADRTERAWDMDKKPEVVLSKSRVNDLLAIINDTATYYCGSTGCFYPRNGFFFYDTSNRLVASYDICFECHQVQFMPAFPRGHGHQLSTEGIAAFRRFIKSLGLILFKDEDGHYSADVERLMSK